jgi:FtsK/SpoIIIE family/FtsK alpha domain
MGRNKSPGMIELIIASGFGITAITGFAMSQTRQPYALTQVQFCPQSANHPNVIDQNLSKTNRKLAKKGKEAKDKKYFDQTAQEELNERFCHQPRFILKEEWDRYGLFGSTIPFKGDAIAPIKDVPVDNPNYVFWNLVGVGSIWGIYACIAYRKHKLCNRDLEFSEEEKSIAHTLWLEQNTHRDLASFQKQLDLEITKEVKQQNHQQVRHELGLTDPNEGYRDQLNAETALLGREVQHSQFYKQRAENLRDMAKANKERENYEKGIGLDGNSESSVGIPTTPEVIKKQGNAIAAAVANFNLGLNYSGATTAPSIIRHKFTFGEKGKKISDIVKLGEDIALALGLEHTPRIVRDKGDIVIEVPRSDREFPLIHQALKDAIKPDKEYSLAIIGGYTPDNKLLMIDLANSADVHALGGGTTNSGKTLGVLAQLAVATSMYTPDELKFAIYDGKNSLILPESLKPWLFCEVAKPDEGRSFIELVENERIKRMNMRDGYQNLREYKEENQNDKTPLILVVMDEYSTDREQFEGKKNEPDKNLMKSFAKKARSEGMHILALDQDCKDENISNRVKSQLATRFIYKMVDSKCANYVEVPTSTQLLGIGDLIVRLDGKEIRCQMPWCKPKDLEEITRSRVEQLNIDITTIELPKHCGLTHTKNGENDWYSVLVDWATENKPNRQQLATKYMKLSGQQPTEESLDILIESLNSNDAWEN